MLIGTDRGNIPSVLRKLLVSKHPVDFLPQQGRNIANAGDSPLYIWQH